MPVGNAHFVLVSNSAKGSLQELWTRRQSGCEMGITSTVKEVTRHRGHNWNNPEQQKGWQETGRERCDCANPSSARGNFDSEAMFSS
jgi:hypothetical protein